MMFFVIVISVYLAIGTNIVFGLCGEPLKEVANKNHTTFGKVMCYIVWILIAPINATYGFVKRIQANN